MYSAPLAFGGGWPMYSANAGAVGRKAKCTKADQLRSISAAHGRSREALRTNEKGEHAVVRESEMAVRDSERRRWSLIYLSAWVSVSESLVEVERQRDFLDFSSSVGPHFF